MLSTSAVEIWRRARSEVRVVVISVSRIWVSQRDAVLVDVVELGDRLDPEAVEDAVAQQVAIARRQRRERVGERLLEVVAVALPEVRERDVASSTMLRG